MVEYYTTAKIAALLGISFDAARMRVYRGIYQSFTFGGRVAGATKRSFWDVCVRQEKVGLIRPQNMPQAYRDERKIHVGAVSYEDNVLRGRSGT